jgi:hypothetical protein
VDKGKGTHTIFLLSVASFYFSKIKIKISEKKLASGEISVH